MEGEFSEVKRRANNKVNEEKIKKHMLNVRGAADGQDDSSTKENALAKNTKQVPITTKQVVPNSNNTAGCKTQNQEKPKVFGKDFLEAPIPKTNPWNKAKSDMPSDMESRSDHNVSEVVCSRNTNAAEITEVENTTHRSRESHEINSDSETARKTYTSPTKGRASQKSAETGMVPAHNSHQAYNPANKTSTKSKFWDKKNKEQKLPQTDLNDSAQWPSLEYLTDKGKEPIAARPKCPQPKAEESNNESDADSQTKPDSPTGDVIDNVNSHLVIKKKNKQKWVQLPIEMKTERRRGSGGNRGRGSSRPQYYEDQQRRNNRPTFRRPNRVRDGSRQGEETDSRVDETERNHVQSGPLRGNSFRGRRGRGRAGYPRIQRDSSSLPIEESAQPFFAPIFIADEADEPAAALPEARPEFAQAASPQENYFESRIKNQIEYYFSEKNLEKDSYLRHQMDESGWVDVNLVCAFPRVKSLSEERESIVAAVRKSSAVEVSEDGQKLRAAVEPQRWPLKPGVEITDAHIPRWKALSSNSKLKADAPVFVPGQQYIPMSCATATPKSHMDSADESLHKQIPSEAFHLGRAEDK